MKQNEMFIAAASSFDAKKDNIQKHYAVLQAVHFDRYDQLKAEAIFTNDDVVKQFSGSGIYQVETVYGQGIVGLKKISSIQL